MSAVIDLVQARSKHIIELAETMREEDRMEVAAFGYTPYVATLRSVHLSGGSAWAMCINGKTAAIGGVMGLGLLQGAGVVWLLTGREVDRHPKAFHRTARNVLATLSKRYPYLMNAVDARYEKSINWLRRLGFAVEDDIMVNGEKFRRVVKRG